MSPCSEMDYIGFWPSFYSSNNTTLKEFFRSLFEGITFSKDLVHIYSVFPNKEQHPDPSAFCIHFSGEPFYDDPQKYDLNLTMLPDDAMRRIVFCPLFSIGSYEYNYWPLYMQPRPLMPKSRFCAFIISNPRASLRNHIYERLKAYKHVDSCGQVLNNCGFCAPRDQGEYLRFLNQFKFMICFENSSSSHYITEKLHNAWLGGTIPIYWGCTNAPKWLNPNAFLYLEDDSEASIQRLIQRVIELDNDPQKYQEMHQQPLILDGKIPHDMDLHVMRAKVKRIVGC